MTRDTRRRLALYGGAVAIAALALALPRLVRKVSGPAIAVFTPSDIEKAQKHEATAMLVDFLKIDTSNPPGVTRPAADFLARAFDCEGIPYEVVGIPDRPVLVARLAGATREGALLLLNHVDVEPPGDLSLWLVPPFAGELGTGQSGSYLYGRGTLDMKGQTVAAFFAMAALKRAGVVPLRDIVFVAESGEETYTPEIGIGWLLKHRPDLLDGVTDAFNEGGVNETVAGDLKRFGVEVLQKATINMWAESEREEDLKTFQEFLLARDAKQPYKIVGPIREFLQFIGPSRSDVWGRSMVDPERVVDAPLFRQWAPDVYKSLVRDGFYPGPVEKKGDRFRMDFAMTLLPGSSTAENLAMIEGWLKERGLTWGRRFVTPDAVAVPQEGRAWDALQTALTLDPDVKADVGIYVLTISYTNSAYLRARGYRAYGISTFNVGINDASKIHHENERILLPHFVEGVERMKRIVLEFATRP